MPRVTKTPVRRRNFAQQAAQQAQATYGPQISGVRQDLHGQVGSLNSMDHALQGSLQIARRNLRHSGLQSDDLSMALRELALRSADVTAGTQLQIQTARQDAQGQIQDLVAQRGATQSSVLSELQQAAQERQQDLADDARSRRLDIRDSIKLESLKKSLGLGDYADDGGAGGISDSDRDSRKAAAFYAKQAFDALRGTGQVDEDPRQWDDATWDAIVGGVHKQKSVGTPEDAARAVHAIRAHFGGGDVSGYTDGGGEGGRGEAGWDELLKALGVLARGTVPPLLAAYAQR